MEVLAALDATSYLISALSELERHAKKKLKESRKLWRLARRATREGSYGEGRKFWVRAEEYERSAKADLEMIQRTLSQKYYTGVK